MVTLCGYLEVENNNNINMKKVIRLTEADLHRLIKESVSDILDDNDIKYKLPLIIKKLEQQCFIYNDLLNQEKDYKNKLYIKGCINGVKEALGIVKELIHKA